MPTSSVASWQIRLSLQCFSSMCTAGNDNTQPFLQQKDAHLLIRRAYCQHRAIGEKAIH